MNSSKIIEDQKKIYVSNFLQHKNSPLGTFQNDRVTQHLRFERIVRPFKDVMTEYVTLHDVGCGVCDLHDYLLANNIRHQYSGTEVIDEMISHAQQKHNGIQLFKRDLLTEPVTDKYHIVVFSGGLYLPGNTPVKEWEEFVFNMVSKMFEMCTIGISFNLLSTYNTYQSPHLYYLDPKRMFDYCCSNFSRFTNLDQSYPLYEWTISVFKSEYIKEQYPQAELAKYLKP